MRRHGAPLLLATILAYSYRAQAFDYQEHQEIVCSALERVCIDEASTRGPRAEHFRAVLCSHACGAHRSTAVEPWIGLFSDVNCHLDLGDAVALADHANLSTLTTLTCRSEDTLREDQFNYGSKALFAEEHFCPDAPGAYAQYHRLALALALMASRSDGHLSLDELRRTLLTEAYALHFFTDNFSAGHLRARLRDTDDNVVTKRVHDWYSEHGLDVSDGRGHKWRAYGDGNLDFLATDIEMIKRAKSEHKQRVVDAVVESLGGVIQTYLKGVRVDDSAYMMAPACIDRARLDSEPQPGDFYQYRAGIRFDVGLESWDFGSLEPTKRYQFRLIGDLPILDWLGVEGGVGGGLVERGYTRADFASSEEPRKQARFRPDLEMQVGVRFNPVLRRYARALVIITPARLTWENFDHGTADPQYPSRLLYDGGDLGIGAEATLLHANVGLLTTLGERQRRVLNDADGSQPDRGSMRFSFGLSLFLGYRW